MSGRVELFGVVLGCALWFVIELKENLRGVYLVDIVAIMEEGGTLLDKSFY